MSKERQKARAVREAARRAEIEAAARRRERQATMKAVLRVPRVRRPRRPRRYGALSTRARYQLLVAFVVVQVLAWYLLPSLGARLCLAVLTAAVLLVLVKTRRSPAR